MGVCKLCSRALYSGYKDARTLGDDAIGRLSPCSYMVRSYNIYPLRADLFKTFSAQVYKESTISTQAKIYS